MTQYELLLIIQNDLSEEKKEAALNKVKEIIEKSNGKIVSVDKWGSKKFAYSINYKDEGFYVLINFEADSQSTKPITSALNITENVVRFMMVAK